MTIGSVKGLTETEQLQAEITRLTALVESQKETIELMQAIINTENKG